MLRVLIILLWISFFNSTIASSQNLEEKVGFTDSTNPYSDSLYSATLSGYEAAVSQNDTNKQIQWLLKIAHFYGSQANYKASYDNLWKGLLIAEQANNLEGISTINLRIGRHYGFYGRKKEALKYFQRSIDAQMTRIKENSQSPSILAENYHNICSFYRDFDDLPMQKQSLDSSKKYIDKERSEILNAMLIMEEAVILTKDKEFTKSKALFKQAYPIINEQLKSYLVLFEFYEAVNLRHLKETKKAESKLKNALRIGYKYNAHLDFIPKIYKELSNIYLQRGEPEKAIEMLNKMANVNFDFFDSRSERNKSLLEIQDEQRKYIEEQEAEIQLIRFEEMENTGKILFFQRALLICGILLLGLFAFYYVKYLTKKYRLEKELAKKKQEMEFEKVQEVIELKNKELATSTLKLIEKDEIVEEFGIVLKSKKWAAEPRFLKNFIRNWDLNRNRNWEEFQTRFTSINSSFYKRLHSSYPNLTASDDKLCALIKLKLSSKEISMLLGLSNESVHTKRSRLRTKLGLDRHVNLTEFIGKF